jgi:hypothetical protein
VTIFDRRPAQLVELREGEAARVLVRGEVAQVLGDLPPPVTLPDGTAPLERIAVLVVEVEHQPFLARPIRERWERARPFLLRDVDGPGRALVRLAPPGLEAGRVGAEVTVRLAGPYTQRVEKELEVTARTVSVGDEVIVVGTTRFEVDRAGQGTYREAPVLPVIRATALFDKPAWEEAAAWHALPWYRKLSLIMRNR